jgi:hypothetical protein
MKYVVMIITLMAILGVTGCGYKEGIVTTEQKSYLYFTGNVKDVKVSLDNGVSFSVESGANQQYKINSGKHLITIYRGNEIIIRRVIFVGDGVTKEIEVQP